MGVALALWNGLKGAREFLLTWYLEPAAAFRHRQGDHGSGWATADKQTDHSHCCRAPACPCLSLLFYLIVVKDPRTVWNTVETRVLSSQQCMTPAAVIWFPRQRFTCEESLSFPIRCNGTKFYSLEDQKGFCEAEADRGAGRDTVKVIWH